MTDIQQVEGAAVVSWDNWGDQYSGPSQGVPSMSLQQIFEYSADEYRESAGYPPLPDALVPLAYAAKHRLEDRPWFTRSFRRGLKGLFR